METNTISCAWTNDTARVLYYKYRQHISELNAMKQSTQPSIAVYASIDQMISRARAEMLGLVRDFSRPIELLEV